MATVATWTPTNLSSCEALASVVVETYNGEDRIRVDYLYPIDDEIDSRSNGSPLGPRANSETLARIDLEVAPDAIESSDNREIRGANGTIVDDMPEEDMPDIVIVQLPVAMALELGKRRTHRSSRRMRRLAEHISKQVNGAR